MKFVFVFALSLFFMQTGQYSQQFRGTVTDQVLQQPLARSNCYYQSLNYHQLSDDERRFSV